MSHKLLVSMARITCNLEIPKRYFGGILQLTNWILDSSVTFHVRLEISDFVLVPLMEMDKYIEVADGNFFTMKRRG